jgi:hypothetical protein
VISFQREDIFAEIILKLKAAEDRLRATLIKSGNSVKIIKWFIQCMNNLGGTAGELCTLVPFTIVFGTGVFILLKFANTKTRI